MSNVFMEVGKILVYGGIGLVTGAIAGYIIAEQDDSTRSIRDWAMRNLSDGETLKVEVDSKGNGTIDVVEEDEA